MRRWLTFTVLGLCFSATVLPGQEKPVAKQAGPGEPAEKENPAHEELRTLYKELVAAFNQGDYERVFTYLDEDVMVTWQNAEVSRKPAGVRAYFDKMMKGPPKRVESITINPEVDELTH